MARAPIDVLPAYDDDAFGIPVTIRNAVLRHRCAACGVSGIEIPDSDDLSAVIAVARILFPAMLRGPEIRAIRKACQMTGKQFAEALGMDNATVSRWENCRGDESHGEVSDRNIRETVWSLLYRRTPAIHVEPGHFRKLDIVRLRADDPLPRLVFEHVRLKDPVRQTKSDEWDIYEHAA